MSAIFVIGGQQYHANIGDTLYVEKINHEVGSVVKFEKVLMLNNKVGTPTLKNAFVECEVVKHGKQPKLTIIKHIPQKHHTKKMGHRQTYTQLLVKAFSK